MFFKNVWTNVVPSVLATWPVSVNHRAARTTPNPQVDGSSSTLEGTVQVQCATICTGSCTLSSDVLVTNSVNSSPTACERRRKTIVIEKPTAVPSHYLTLFKRVPTTRPWYLYNRGIGIHYVMFDEHLNKSCDIAREIKDTKAHGLYAAKRQ